ncbi:hypothetical protein M1349_05350 [Patescibacteria group bacterium]|nr:hypothetical protein [Patescibacteria group bacterium]
MKKLFFSGVVLFVQILLLLSLAPASSIYAADLSPLKDTLSTSRTSPSTVIDAYQAGSLLQAQFKDPVGAFYLSSDSAKIYNNLGAVVDTGNVASMSALNTPSAGKRVVYFTSALGSTAHYPGEPLVVPITAMHSISFRTGVQIPATTGTIAITFPTLASGDSNTTASPSASTFQLNGLATGQVKIWDVTGAAEITGFTVAITNPTAGTSPVVTITLGATNMLAARDFVIYLGCTAVNAAGCTAGSPRIINPTKTAANGTSDGWRVRVLTRDTSGGGTDLESGSTRIATIESVTVQGIIEPTLTFTIAGVASNYNFNAVTGCVSETVNTGVASTATFVDMGILVSPIRISGQTLTVTTNTTFGYSITATTSGQFKDPSSGSIIGDVNTGTGLTANNVPAPAGMTAGTTAFGVFPCGSAVPAASPNWNAGNTIGGGAAGAYGMNPWNVGVNNFYATIATRAVAPTGGTETTAVRYAATVAAAVPAGVYSNAFTYVASANF